MKVILTHNAADFDAVASLMAMHKLEPDAIPVLPAQVNNNVSQFLLLYARELPMIEREDVPREHVECVFAVDTQRFDMVRGMDAKTPVYIIDHHDADERLPEHYHYSGEPTGANTTLLVERIIEQKLSVSGVEATLLLLGIYEDTGSLSYKVTTPRDMQAAAWLLRHGGDLDIVRQFMEHSMNDAQMNLFHRLQESTMNLLINGHTIILASTIIPEQVREAAIVAHELLELFGGDALFMVIQVKDDVQIIARTTAESINLGEMVQQFGGNGHSYAAAAFIRDASLTSVLNQIIDLLPTYILPATRVKDLMSWGVQCIDHDTDITTAQNIMLETGHEGYPVLRDARVVGLLTHRAVDRAILHDLHKLPVSEIMEAGTHTVTPTDSVEKLKERMLATGWGQMPVVSEGGEVIGIVTRTDLIKQWDQRPHRRTMWQHLQNMLSPGVRALLEAASGMAESQNRGLYLVGGIVRDMLLERPNLDIDLVVEGDAIALAKALVDEYGGDLHQHRQFGTAKWILNPSVMAALGFKWNHQIYPDSIDFATSRAEFYEAPTVLPTVRRGSIKLDLHRRDFTINAMAIRLAPPPIGELMDFYNGERDLENGMIRVLHSLSFIDDPTRIIRAVRFEQRFGFQIEPRTEELMHSALPLLDRVSGDRIRQELNHILAEPNALAALERLESLGMLSVIHPALKLNENIRRYYGELQKARHNPPWKLADDFDNWRVLTFAILTAELSDEDLETLSRRLQLSRGVYDALRAVKNGQQKLDEINNMPPSQVVQHFEAYGEISWLANWIMSDSQTRATLEKLATEWRFITPALDGDALKAMGLQPSPLMGEILRELRDARLDKRLEDEDDERQYAQRRINEYSTGSQ